MSKKTISLTFDLYIDFELIGICTSLPHYQICYFINKVLNSQLGRLNEDIELIDKDKTVSFFPSYADERPEENHIWYLIQNKVSTKETKVSEDENKPELLFNLKEVHNKDHFLIPDRKDVNYFLQVHPPILEKDITQIKQKINEIDAVKNVFSIDPNTTKKIDNLLIR